MLDQWQRSGLVKEQCVWNCLCCAHALWGCGRQALKSC